MDFVAILIFATILYYVLFSIIKFRNPEVVEIEGKFYIRRWSFSTGWAYHDSNRIKFKDQEYWWYNLEYVSKYCAFDTEEEAVAFYKKLKEVKKKPKVRKVDLKKYL